MRLADEALEDAIPDSRAMRAFIGGDVVPDATTLLGFRHLLGRARSDPPAFCRDQRRAQLSGVSSCVKVPSWMRRLSPRHSFEQKQSEGTRSRRCTKPRRATLGTSAGRRTSAWTKGTGLVHTVVGTAANVSDVSQAHHLAPWERRNCVWATPGYQGVEKRPEMVARFGHLPWIVAAKRGKIKAMAEGKIKELTLAVEKTKAQMRALVEHPFHVLKNLFGHRKVRYRGLAKNTAQLHTLFALANLVLVGRPLRTEVRG